MYVKGWITLCASVAIGAWGSWYIAALATVLGLVWAWTEFRDRNGASVVLTVRGGRLRIERPSVDALDLALEELHDVRLDTKTTSKDMTVARADVSAAYGASAPKIELDVSRIELVLDEEDALLAPEFINASLCMETMRSMRLFLRAHGWKPLDERTEGTST